MQNYISVIERFHLLPLDNISYLGKDNSILPSVDVYKTKDGLILFFFNEYKFLNSSEYKKLVSEFRKIDKDTYRDLFKKFLKDDFDKYDLEPKKIQDRPELIERRNEKMTLLYKAILTKKKNFVKLYKKLLSKYNNQITNNIDFIAKLLVYEVFEYGLLSFFFRSNDIEEIYIGTTLDKGEKETIYLDHRKYSRVLTNLTFTSPTEFTVFVKSAGSFLSRIPSESNPLVNTKIPYGRGGRVQITIKPSALETEGYVNIRLFPLSPFNIVKIIKWGSIPIEILPYFVALFETKGNTMVCGETGSGKTTLLNALMGFAPSSLRTIIVEETPEIILEGFSQVVKIVSTENAPLEDIISASLRQTPQIYILGEVRTKEEIQGYLRTTSAGQANLSIATFHAGSIEGFIERLKKEADASISQIKTIDVIVFQNKMNIRKEGRDIIVRKTTGVYELLKSVDERLLFSIINYFKNKFKLENYSQKEIIEFITETVKALGGYEITYKNDLGELVKLKLVYVDGDILYFLTLMDYDPVNDRHIIYDGVLRYSEVVKRFMKKLKYNDFDKFKREKWEIIKKIINIYVKKNLEKLSFKQFVQQWNIDRNFIYKSQ